MSDYAVKRDYFSRVLVMPPGAEPMTGEWRTSKNQKRYFKADQREAEGYRRTSKSGEHLKGGGDGLANWKAAMAAVGVLLSDSARSQIVNLINEYDKDPYYKGDDGGTESGKSRLLKAVDLACEVAGASSASSRGTEFHKLGELVNKGIQPALVQPEIAPLLMHYRQRVAPVRFLAQEILIVNDTLKCAGSIDYLMQLPPVTTPDGVFHKEGLVCAGDLKTGKWDVDYCAGVSAQLAGYGLGQRYDQETNTRTPLHPSASDRWAVLVHFPISRPHPKVDFYFVDMHKGLEAAQLNAQMDELIKHFKSVGGKPIKFELEY